MRLGDIVFYLKYTTQEFNQLPEIVMEVTADGRLVGSLALHHIAGPYIMPKSFYSLQCTSFRRR